MNQVAILIWKISEIQWKNNSKTGNSHVYLFPHIFSIIKFPKISKEENVVYLDNNMIRTQKIHKRDTITRGNDIKMKFH